MGEAAEVIAEHAACNITDVKIGQLRPLSNGLYSVWAQCSLSAAIKMAKLGKIRIGWTVARVELLKSRPTQCFKCWGTGHIQSKCKADVDRSGLCYRCGKPGHLARGCLADLCCALCLSKGTNACHRVGSGQCKSVKGNGCNGGKGDR